MANNMKAFFGEDHPTIKNVWNVPTKLNIFHQNDEHIIYDPITNIELQRTCICSHAENWAEGFLASMRYFVRGEHSNRGSDGTDDYEAYLAGQHAGNELCTLHQQNGGTFDIRE
jgi:hypothetical protein